jgi:hypothetical protein
MKNKKLVIFVLLFIVMSLSFLNAQDETVDHFTSIRSLPVYAPAYSSAHRYFSFAEVDNGYLSLIVSENHYLTDYLLYSRNAYWYSNPSGNPGYYSNANQFYNEITYQDDIHKMFGIVSVDLGSGKLNPILVRDNQTQIHQNTGTISGIAYSNPNMAGSYITKGRFDNSDDKEDVGITVGNKICIFKNNYNGSLDANDLLSSYYVNLHKYQIVQIDDQIDLFKDLFEPNPNKDDIIGFNGTNIYIYLNNNNNSVVTTPQVINTEMNIQDFDVTDFNNDGRNDLVVVGATSVKVYLNNWGTISSTPSYTRATTNGTYLVKAKDINMDGVSDIVELESSGIGYVFINSNYGLNFSLQQTIPIHFAMTGSIDQMDLVDIYNKGGLALVYSGSYGNMYNLPNQHGIYIADAITQDKNPTPPHIFQHFVQTGFYWRPQIKINDRHDRDIAQYQIWKKGVGENYFTYFATISSAQKYWTDMSEYIVWTEGDDGDPTVNCSYYVQCVDQTQNASLPSNSIGYHVQGPTPLPPPQDNSLHSPEINTMPKDYNICNFPNPFNPVTKILYSLPKDGFVKIAIYDILGREIVKVTNEFKKKGNYIYDFNASKYSSGIYFYTFEVNGYRVTKSMLLVK